MGKLGNIEAPSRDPSAYELVIVCTPVWAWHVSPPVHAYLALTKEHLPSVAFVVVSAGFVDKDFSAKNQASYDAKIADLLMLLRNSRVLSQK
jgi:hypothetical protein